MSGEAAEAARRWNQQSNRKRRGETSDADAAFKKIRYSTESRIPAAETRRKIAVHFNQNEDIVMPTYRVSLLCPLSKARMSVAARGVNCKHFRCFDLEKYLQCQVQNSLWACPIAGCSKEVRQAQLRVDEYFCAALEALSNRREVTNVDLLPHGDYVAVEPPACEDVPDDGSPYVPELAKPKSEHVDASNGPAAPEHGVMAPNGTVSTDLVGVDFVVIDDEEPMEPTTAVRRRQRKPRKRRRLVQKEPDKLLDSLAKKQAKLNRREEELQSANEEIQRLREALAGKERKERQLGQNLSEADADRARLRQSLQEAKRRPCDEALAKYIPCAIRSLQDQIDSVQRDCRDLKAEIGKIEKIKSDIRSLEETAGQISTDWPLPIALLR